MPSYFKRVMDSPTFSFVSIDERRGKWIEGKGKKKQKEAAIVILPALNPHWKEGYHLELLILFALIWGVLIARGELTPKGINLEVQALIAIKTEFIDPENALASWDGTAVDPCGWYHVTCSNRQSVISMILPNHQLSGTLSPNFGNLKNLEILVLENNNISGKIPPEMGKLSKLASLDLSNNHLGGEIPQSIGNLKSLTYLRLSNNSLIGAFPASLARIHSLDFVDLSFNNLSGSVPHLSATTFNISGNPLLCGSNTNLRCPDGDPSLPASISAKASNGTDSSTKSKRAAIAVGATGFIVLSVCTSVAVILWKRYRKRPVFIDVNEQLDQGTSLGQLKKFSFRDLQVATNNFHAKNILGSGGFGNVYKGCMPDGSLIAVKRLKDRDTGGEVQFQMEVEMISLAVHRNVLRLLGYCVTSTERLLVYPYMPNGSVASRLRDKPVLDWPTRKRIAVGAARGLLYLHEQCDAKIIHRDVKAGNILLDEEFEAVVCDFGLAKFLDHKETHVTTAVRGTVGHIAPEYLSTGRSSEKTDVYGFGILLLELITGQRAIDFRRVSNQKGYLLLDWVKKLQEEGRLVELVDVELRQSCNAIELEEMVQLALLCTQFFPTDRPKMLEVVRMLEGDGLSERWEEWKKAADHCQGAESQSQRYYDLVEDSSLVVEAVELSGPR